MVAKSLVILSVMLMLGTVIGRWALLSVLTIGGPVLIFSIILSFLFFIKSSGRGGS